MRIAAAGAGHTVAVLPPTVRASVDDRRWRSAARLVVVAAGAVALPGAPTVATAVGAAAVLAAFAVAVVTMPSLGGALRPAAERPFLPWPAVLVADLAVAGLAGLLLFDLGLGPVAMLAPLALVGAQAHEHGAEAARTGAGLLFAGLVALVLVGPGPPPSWRDAVALCFTFALGALAVLAGSSVREAEAVTVEDRASIQAFRESIITTVSHELRTPLTIVQGITWALVSRWDQLPETQKLDLIDTLSVNIASLDASVLHFLDAGRLARGEWELRPGWVDAAAMVQQVVAKLGPVLAGYDVQPRIEVEQVWGDEEALGRALELLLVNACRFSPPASAIGVRVTGGAGGYEISVADRGQGISPRDLPHVFEPLWRSDVQESGVSRGAGLGLAIVKELAERHGGRASVTSVRQRGSTFRITLPAAPQGSGG